MARKIIINRQHGGFRLSEEAFEKLIKDYGWSVDTWDDRDYPDTDIVKDENPKGITGAKYSFTDKHRGKEKRTNKEVISVVEELGDKANTKFSNLKIVEIPEDIEYEIKEYDGMEWIAEKHRTWS